MEALLLLQKTNIEFFKINERFSSIGQFRNNNEQDYIVMMNMNNSLGAGQSPMVRLNPFREQPCCHGGPCVESPMATDGICSMRLLRPPQLRDRHHALQE